MLGIMGSVVIRGGLLCMSTKVSSIVKPRSGLESVGLVVNIALKACWAVNERLKEKSGCVNGCTASKTSSQEGKSHSISGSQTRSCKPRKNRNAQSVKTM
jgi:hypothetical protein